MTGANKIFKNGSSWTAEGTIVGNKRFLIHAETGTVSNKAILPLYLERYLW